MSASSRTDSVARHVVIAGMGRAGSSFSVAAQRAGWTVTGLDREQVGRLNAVPHADLFMLCVPDGAIAELAAMLAPNDQTVVVHCAGSVPVSVLQDHPYHGGIHPMVSLGGSETGATALNGAWCGVAWNSVRAEQTITALLASIAARSFQIADHQRGIYHAAAAVASNHLVALSAQVERLANEIGVPVEVYWDLMAQTLASIAELGPERALTGPVARGDWDTVKTHLESLDESEHATYLALANEAARLARRDFPKM